MFEDTLPDKKIGYLSLRIYIENQAYEFYRLAPPGIMLMLMPCGLREYTPEEAKRVVREIDPLLDQLIARKVDIVLQGGLPIPLLIGPAAHDDMIGHIAEYTGRPAVSQMQNIIAAMKQVGMQNVLVVNRWKPEMNDALTEFLARDGIAVAGISSHSIGPDKTYTMSNADTAEMAYELALAGIEAHPDADGIYIGGSVWLAQPVIERLEAETGKPVIGNHGATLWDMLRRLDKWRPIPGRGRLLESD